MPVRLARQIEKNISRINAVRLSEQRQLPDAFHPPDNFRKRIFQCSHFRNLTGGKRLFSNRIEIERKRRLPEKLLCPTVTIIEHN